LELRLRWMGAILLLLVVVAAAYLTVRYYGVRSGWWPTLLPTDGVFALAHHLLNLAQALLDRGISWLKS